jgi:flagellar basal-body rod modification protein FlgD
MVTTPTTLTATAGAAAASTTDKTGAAAAAAPDAAAKASVDYQSFLKLLTAQLKNQDPLAPMDASQFMTQLAQFSTVEQAVQTNQKLESVLGELKSSGARFDMAYLGRKVEASTDTFGLTGGTNNLAYTVDAGAATVRIDIVDDSGRTVRSLPGETGAGRHALAWDGKRTDGSTAPDGTYRTKIVARNKAGDTVASASVVVDTVKEVRQVDGASLFTLTGGDKVQGKDILGVTTG